MHVVIPDITRRHWAVNIRKFGSDNFPCSTRSL